MEYGFYAMLNRMKLINRWSLMRNTSQENIQEHSLQVAILAHALAILRREKFPEDRICPSPEHVAVLAIFHDASEIITGDMPTPIKYFNPKLREAYQVAEDAANDRLLGMLPEEMRPHYQPYLNGADSEEDLAARELVKAADKLAAYIKCVEELAQGNNEFKLAKIQCKQKVDEMGLKEVDYFMEQYMPAFERSLDELQAD